MAQQKLQIKNKYLKLLIKKSSIKKGGMYTENKYKAGEGEEEEEGAEEKEEDEEEEEEEEVIEPGDTNKKEINKLSGFIADSIFTSMKPSNSTNKLSEFIADSIFTSMKYTINQTNVENSATNKLSEFIADSIFTSMKSTNQTNEPNVENSASNNKLSEFIANSIFTSMKPSNKRVVSEGFPTVTKPINLMNGGGFMNFKKFGKITDINLIFQETTTGNINFTTIHELNLYKNEKQYPNYLNKNMSQFINRDGVNLNKQIKLHKYNKSYGVDLYHDIKNILIQYQKSIKSIESIESVDENTEKKSNQKMADFLATAIFDSMITQQTINTSEQANNLENTNQKMADFLATAIFESMKTQQTTESNIEKSNNLTNQKMADFLATAIFESMKPKKTSLVENMNKFLKDFLKILKNVKGTINDMALSKLKEILQELNDKYFKGFPVYKKTQIVINDEQNNEINDEQNNEINDEQKNEIINGVITIINQEVSDEKELAVKKINELIKEIEQKLATDAHGKPVLN